jgi:hypothetical protein
LIVAPIVEQFNMANSSNIVYANPLQGVSILELDITNTLTTWSFPIIEKATESIIKSRTNLLENHNNPALAFEPAYRWSRYSNSWHYILNAPLSKSLHSKLTAVSIVILSQTYNPSKYHDLASKFLQIYLDNPAAASVEILKAYLSVFTTNSFIYKEIKFSDSDYDNRKALVAPLKHTIQQLGPECTILLWNAVLLKKRILLYNSRLAELLPIIQCIPALGSWHRNSSNLTLSNPAVDSLRPYITLANDAESVELQKELGYYIAGTINPAHSNRSDLFDLYIDTNNKSYTVNESEKGAFQLTKLHKTTAEQIISAADVSNTSSTDQSLIKLIAANTKQLLDNILSLRSEVEGQLLITAEGLAGQNLPLGMQKFIYAVANAEGLTRSQAQQL